MIKCSPPKGQERPKAKLPFDPKGKQERVHNVNTHTHPLGENSLQENEMKNNLLEMLIRF